MTKESHIKEIDELVSKANLALTESQSMMQGIFAQSTDEDFSRDSPEENARTLQLALQYRLDTQDALVRLMHVDRSILQILGLEGQSAAGVNIERMAFAIGEDDLHQILFALSRLVEALLQVAHLYQNKLKSYSEYRKENLKQKNLQSKRSSELSKAIKKQKLFTETISEIGLKLDLLVKREALGPVMNHISALRGPISRFYQALQSGLMHSHRLYEKTSQGMKFDKNLASLLNQVDSVMKQLSSVNQHQLFQPAKQSISAEKLEQRAAKRRLGHFLGH